MIYKEGLLMLFILIIPYNIVAEEDLSEFQKQASVFEQYCVKCHTIGKGDRVGPDLKGVAKRRTRKWIIEFINNPDAYLDSDPIAKELLKKYNDVRMTNLGLAPARIESIVDYINTVSEGNVGEEETVGPEDIEMYEGATHAGSVVGIFILILTLLTAVILWEIGARKSTQLALVFAVGLTYYTFFFHQNHHLPGNQQGYEPIQPIAYSHKLHAGDLEINCLYCHHGAEKGPVAGIPEVKICMNCHNVVKKTSFAKVPSVELEKLFEIWGERDIKNPGTIPWVRVHRLPDYVYFNHASHVQNNIKCQECHGQVQTMEVMRQESDLSMGWCLNCHRNKSMRSYTHWKRLFGPTDCVACHI